MSREDARWLAVYGAAFAIQFDASMTHGDNPSDEAIDRFVEEAEAQADAELDWRCARAKRDKRNKLCT